MYNLRQVIWQTPHQRRGAITPGDAIIITNGLAAYEEFLGGNEDDKEGTLYAKKLIAFKVGINAHIIRSDGTSPLIVLSLTM